jgi:hypothetical protein
LAQCHIDTGLGFGFHWLKRSWWCQDIMVCSIPTITINGSYTIPEEMLQFIPYLVWRQLAFMILCCVFL